MKERPLTRRRFLEGCAGVGAAACCGFAGAQAFAEGGRIGANARPEWDVTHTLCQACPNWCGFAAYTVDGKLGKTLGNPFDPNARGRLCARGYGYTNSVDSDARVKNPMRRKENGGFQTISWDEAFAEIGEKLAAIVDVDGAEALACVYDGAVPDARIYSNLLMNALGSGNVYVDDLIINTVKGAAAAQTIGAHGYHPDIDNASAVVLVDSSLADITTPDLVASLEKAHADGRTIVAVDPRLGSLAQFADAWYPVNPGTELALVLAVCNFLVTTGRYDQAFVAANVEGFDAWSRSVAAYTPRWAEGVTGLESFRIEELASVLADAAPRVAIEYGNGRIAGTSYANSAETMQAICLLEALLGAWGQPGGACLPFDYDAALAQAGEDAMPGSDNAYADEGIAFPEGMRLHDVGAAALMELIAHHRLRGLVTVGADVAYDYSSVPKLHEGLDSLDLFVCVTEEFTQTAEGADYVLPLASYLEAGTLPVPVQAGVAAFAMASPVLEPADGDNARALADIMDGLADSAGVKADFAARTLAAAERELGAFGMDLASLEQLGTAEVASGSVQRVSAWSTPSGKIECAPGAQADAAGEMLPIWVPPLAESNVQALVSSDMNSEQKNRVAAVLDEDEPLVFKLIVGQQTALGMHGYNVPELAGIAERYELDRVWINRQVAEMLGIADNDEVVLYNDAHVCQAKAFVTDRIVPTAVYLPLSFGRTAERQRTAAGKGTNPLLFSEELVMDRYGDLCIQEACVGVWTEKEGA